MCIRFDTTLQRDGQTERTDGRTEKWSPAVGNSYWRAIITVTAESGLVIGQQITSFLRMRQEMAGTLENLTTRWRDRDGHGCDRSGERRNVECTD